MSTDSSFGEVRLFDDFNRPVIDTNVWTAASTNSATAFAINTQVNGVIRGTVTNNSSNDLSVVYSALNYQAANGGIVFEARCAIATSLSQLIFIGLSDEATTERPIDYNGGTLTTTATDAVGFYYAGGEASATWRYGGVKNGTDSAHAAAASRFNPVLATFQTFKIVVNADGSASFYINGDRLAENVANCVTAGTSLTPYLAHTDDGAAGSFDADYCFVKSGRE